MRNILLFLTVIFVLLAGADSASAQTENPQEKKQTRSGSFVIQQAENGKYYFVLKSSNGQEILKGYQFGSEEKVREAVAGVKAQAADESNFDPRSETQFYFFLKGSDGKAIGRSENYTTEAAMKRGIEAVKRTAPDAEIKPQ